MDDILSQYKNEKQILEEKIQNGNHSKSLRGQIHRLQIKIDILENIQKFSNQIAELQLLLGEMDKDDELYNEIHQENITLKEKISSNQKELEEILLTESSEYYESILIELRAGTGGDEASIFAFNLMELYIKYAQNNQLKCEILEINDNGIHGIRYGLLNIKSNKNTYEYFQFESGVHRVQRVPLTEANGRIHTSTATVAILPEPESNEEIELKPKDLKIDTYRASGAGGQHVNKTDSAVRITHLPTNIVVQCQTEKSQLQNRERCMKLLRAKLFEQQIEERREKADETRRQHVGSGDRCEKYRTYNYPQNRITDHRYNITVYNLDIVMKTGDLNPFLHQLMEIHKKNLTNVQ